MEVCAKIPRLWKWVVECERKRTLEIGARLQRAMEIAGIHDEQLAQKVGVSRSTVANWRSGLRPIPADRIEVACNLLKITPDLLICGESYNPALELSKTEVRNLRAFRKLSKKAQELITLLVEYIARIDR